MDTKSQIATAPRARAAGLGAVLFTAALCACAAGACTDDEEGGGTAPAGAPQVARGQRGESCEFKNDCEEGLACIHEVCVLTDYNIAPSANDCRIIECQTERDCCNRVIDQNVCDQLSTSCRTGDQFACNQFDQVCRCNEAAWNCNDQNVCEFVARCATDAECPGSAPRCVNRVCSQCGADTDCGGNSICREGFCQSRCNERNDCPYFHACTDGVCVEDGCATDRECMAFLDNPLGRCAQDPVAGLPRCTLECQSDSECNAAGYRFEACVEGQCQYIGCDTVEECRIFFDLPVGADIDVVCD